MNHTAKTFLEGYYQDVLHSVSAVTEVFKATGDYESDPSFSVAFCFAMSSFVYVEHCGGRVTDEIAALAMDVYFYLNDDNVELVHEFDADNKRSYIFGFIERLSESEPLTLDRLESSLGYVLNICKAYDDASDSAVSQLLLGALTRFAYLLIQCDGEITQRESEFYELFKRINTLDDTHEVANSGELARDEEEANSCLPSSSQECSLPAIIDEVNSLIGLDGIKSEISDMINLLRVQQLRKQSGLATPDISKHMVFYGNPGTGKTTIARKIAAIYRSLCILSKGHLVEADRSSLVAGYLGQTAIKTKQVLESALGGILFIDEAYTLSQGGEQDQYGQEAIDTILKFMEDNRDDLIVVVAGYETRMAAFIDSNPGLKSRFSKYFRFPDYSSAELSAIFADFAKQSNYHLTPSFASTLNRICELMTIRKSVNFGNGRTIRNLFEKCMSNQANRVVLISNPSHNQLVELVAEDLAIQDLELVMQ